MADADLQIRAGGRGGQPDPEMGGGGSPKSTTVLSRLGNFSYVHTVQDILSGAV